MLICHDGCNVWSNNVFTVHISNDRCWTNSIHTSHKHPSQTENCTARSFWSFQKFLKHHTLHSLQHIKWNFGFIVAQSQQSYVPMDVGVSWSIQPPNTNTNPVAIFMVNCIDSTIPHLPTVSWIITSCKWIFMNQTWIILFVKNNINNEACNGYYVYMIR